MVGSEFWRHQHESMGPACLVSKVQAGGGVMVWVMFSWHTFIPINHCLNANLSIAADHHLSIYGPNLLSSNGYFQ